MTNFTKAELLVLRFAIEQSVKKLPQNAFKHAASVLAKINIAIQNIDDREAYEEDVCLKH